MATAKLNREKLKKMMSQKDEAPLTIGKKRKADTSSKKTTDERVLLPPPPLAPKPSAPEPVQTSSVEVVEIPAEPSSSMFMEKIPTLPRDASLACRRAKSAVMKDDLREYDKVNTDVVKVAGVHSLMKVCSLLLSHLRYALCLSETDYLSLCVGPDRAYGDRQPLHPVGGGVAKK